MTHKVEELEVVITFPGSDVERVFYVEAEWRAVPTGPPDPETGYPPEAIEWRTVKVEESLRDDHLCTGGPCPELSPEERAAVETAARQRWDDDMEAAAERAYERRLEGR